MITGATSGGFRNILPDAGILIENFQDVYNTISDYDDVVDAVLIAMDSKDNLGITRGGNHFTSEAEMRQIEFDGSRVRFKGDSVKDSVMPKIETTLLEYNKENLRRIVPSSDVNTVGGKTVMRERLQIKDTDYMKSLSWVRERKDGAIMIFTLFNPINESGMDSTGEDKNESSMAVTFIGTNDDFEDLQYAPYELVIFEKTT